jgi:hypothetical protein
MGKNVKYSDIAAAGDGMSPGVFDAWRYSEAVNFFNMAK